MTDQNQPPITTEFFFTEDIKQCVDDARLQREGHAWTNPDVDFDLVTSKRGAIEAGASTSIEWIYFRSPPWTWEEPCGREGWLLVDPKTLDQFDFSMTVMN